MIYSLALVAAAIAAATGLIAWAKSSSDFAIRLFAVAFAIQAGAIMIGPRYIASVSGPGLPKGCDVAGGSGSHLILTCPVAVSMPAGQRP